MSSLWQFRNYQKGCVSVLVCSLLPSEPVLGVTPGLPVLHCLHVISHSFNPDTFTISKVLTQQQFATHGVEATPAHDPHPNIPNSSQAHLSHSAPTSSSQDPLSSTLFLCSATRVSVKRQSPESIKFPSLWKKRTTSESYATPPLQTDLRRKSNALYSNPDKKYLTSGSQ